MAAPLAPTEATTLDLLATLKRDFSLDELRVLCLALDVDYDNLDGRTKDVKAISLIEYCEQRDQLDRLRAAVNAPKPPCPYPGMTPFRQADARFFHGRDIEIQRLLTHLRHERTLFVIGPSGSGKSSLVSAGLLPRLADSSLLPDRPWLVRSFRPGAQPVEALADALHGDPTRPAEAVAALLAAHPPYRRLFLVVDQFEEAFAQARRVSQTAFFDALQSLIAVKDCVLLLAVRADFYPDLMLSPLWPVAQAYRLEIAPLRGEVLRLALERPARDLGVYPEAGLLERLVADAADEPGALPLVQETMVHLWDRMQHRLLALADYQALGTDGRSGLAVAVAAKADAVLHSLTADQPAIARRLLLRLVQFGEGRPDTRRRQHLTALASTSDDPAQYEAVLRHLTAHRLLTLSGEDTPGRVPQVDLAHEVLITGWPVFQGWLADRREAEQTRRRLEDHAAEWVRLGRADGGLLDAAELPEAERWLASPDAADLGLSADLPALVAASRAALVEAERQRDAQRQRELAQAQALALEQQRRAEAERQGRRRLSYAAVGLFMLACLAVAFAVYAFAKQQEAITQSNWSRSRQLAAIARTQLAVDPERALLIALEAVQTVPSLEAEDGLRLALAVARPVITLRGHTGSVSTARFSPDGKRVVTASADKTARLWDSATGALLIVLVGHTDAVTNAAFSPGMSQVVTVSVDKTARIWDIDTGRQVAVLVGHQAVVTGAQFSPDGAKLVTFSGDPTTPEFIARIWDTSDWHMQALLTGHTSTINSVQISPDGQRIITASDDKTARVWDSSNGHPLAILAGHTSGISSAQFSPDGTRAVTASADNTVRIWETDTGRQLLVLSGHTRWVTSAQFSSDGQRILTASWDETVRVWDASTGQEIARHPLRPSTGDFYTAQFSPDGSKIVGSGGGNTVDVWDIPTNRELLTLGGHTRIVNYATFSPDGMKILTASEDYTARIWDIRSISGEGAVLARAPDIINSAEFSPDGTRVVTASGYLLEGDIGLAQIWDPNTGQEVAVLQGHKSSVNMAQFSPDGVKVVTASGSMIESQDNTARVWEGKSGRELATLTGHVASLTSARFSADGGTVLTASEDGTARLWDANSGLQLLIFSEHKSRISGALFSPDGAKVVTASGLSSENSDNTARVWDAHTGRELAVLNGHTGPVSSAEFSPDGAKIVTASWDNTARVWDASSGRELAILRGHSGSVNSAHFSPDGQRIVTAGGSLLEGPDDTARVWDASSGRQLALLVGHSGSVSSATFSPDGLRIATASSDNTARLWDASTGHELAVLRGHENWVTSARFSPDGTKVVTASLDGTARVYLVHLADLLTLAQSRLSRQLTCEERQQYLGEANACPTPTP